MRKLKNKKYTNALKLVSDSEKPSGKCKYITNIKDYDRWFNILNQEIFNLRLRKFDSVDIRRRRNTWAYVIHFYKDDTINNTIETISIDLHLYDKYPSFKRFVEILGHEMVHAWQIQNGHIIKHNESFWGWKDKFQKKGLNLFEKYK